MRKSSLYRDDSNNELVICGLIPLLILLFGYLPGSTQQPDFGVVNRPNTSRRLIGGRPADRSAGPTKLIDKLTKKSPGLIDVDMVGLVLNKESRRNEAEIPVNSIKKNRVVHTKFIEHFCLFVCPFFNLSSSIKPNIIVKLNLSSHLKLVE